MLYPSQKSLKSEYSDDIELNKLYSLLSKMVLNKEYRVILDKGFYSDSYHIEIDLKENEYLFKLNSLLPDDYCRFNQLNKNINLFFRKKYKLAVCVYYTFNGYTISIGVL